MRGTSWTRTRGRLAIPAEGTTHGRSVRQARISDLRARRGGGLRQRRRECPVPLSRKGASPPADGSSSTRVHVSRESPSFLLSFLSFRPVARRPGHSLRHVSTSFRTTPSRGVRAAEEPAAVPREGFPLRLSRPLSRASFARHGGERPTIARTPVRAAVARSPSSATRGEARERGRKQSLGTKTTLSQAWSGNCIRGPQCAFEMSMFMCPAVHKLTRN